MNVLSYAHVPFLHLKHSLGHYSFTDIDRLLVLSQHSLTGL